MLGRLPSKRDPRTLLLTTYLPRELPPLPERVRWDAVKGPDAWGMDGNDRFGNCVIVTAAHMLDSARANESKKMRRLSDKQVVHLSAKMRALNGYTILERLKWWRNLGMWHSKILAFVKVPSMQHDYIKSAINIFGAADIGVWMPRAWDGASIWDTGTGPRYRPGGWGGHSVPILGYEPSAKHKVVYKVCTWGKIIDMTYDAVDQYVDEVWASILPAWYRHDKITPSGFDYKGLKSDLELLR